MLEIKASSHHASLLARWKAYGGWPDGQRRYTGIGAASFERGVEVGNETGVSSSKDGWLQGWAAVAERIANNEQYTNDSKSHLEHPFAPIVAIATQKTVQIVSKSLLV